MNIKKRDGKLEPVSLSKIENRIINLKFKRLEGSKELDIDVSKIVIKVVEGIYDEVSSRELDILASEVSIALSTDNLDYGKLASRLEVSSLHKDTKYLSFSGKMKVLNKCNRISDSFYKYIIKNKDILDRTINYNRDYFIDFFGIRTLKKSYLLRDSNRVIIERPQDMWMRVASYIYQGDIERTIEAYNLMSNKYFIYATPTLFNAGTNRPQLSSCFLLDIQDDSISGIYKTISDCAKISQNAGGIGLSIHSIRSKGSFINGTGGISNGIVPMLNVFNSTARYVDQGGNKRKGAMAIYIEPWHADIFEFLDLKKNHGKEEIRARDLFYGLWIPDLFMQRVRDDGRWSLFDPKEAKCLYESFGNKFNEEYCRLEREGMEVKTIKARTLWYKIIESQIETGTPYMLYKDSCNEKSNQKNLGVIKSSNLCTEIIEYTDSNETAVCNLGSISLPSFIEKLPFSIQSIDVEENSNLTFNYDKLYEVTRLLARGLDNIIDLNYYPVKEAEYSNKKNRPIGIGVQGLADLFAILKLEFNSHEAKSINKRIFETIYKAAVDESIKLAEEKGTYKSYKGSPTENGKLQFNLWNKENNLFYDWSDTYSLLRKYGIRNSLLCAPMPTASTSQILGNNEAIEPFTSNIYSRGTSSGEFMIVNKYLINELNDLGIWNEKLKNKIIKNRGSVLNIEEIPNEIRLRYKTVWEMKMKDIIDMSADRAPFICQSQSLNLFVADPNYSNLTSMHFYAWEKGLKTGMYYLRTKPATNAIQFSLKEDVKDVIESDSCSLEEGCESCSG